MKGINTPISKDSLWEIQSNGSSEIKWLIVFQQYAFHHKIGYSLEGWKKTKHMVLDWIPALIIVILCYWKLSMTGDNHTCSFSIIFPLSCGWHFVTGSLFPFFPLPHNSDSWHTMLNFMVKGKANHSQLSVG